MKKYLKVLNKKFYFDSEKLSLYECDNNNNDIDDKNIIEMQNNPTTLTKAVFNVANCCNLKCIYCYGSGGNYGRENQIMTKEVADQIINEIKSKYKKIYNAFFFGGEPLANFEILKYMTNNLKNMTSKFRIVTNAILLTEEIVEFLKENNFKIYISLDGPEYINDNLRGKGTFSIIDKWLKYFIKKGMSEQVEISCTYTKFHNDNISMAELLEFFESYGLKYMLHTVSTTNKELLFKPKEGPLKYEQGFIDRSLERLYKKSNNCCLSSYVKNVLDALCISKQQKCFCRELDRNLSIVYDFNGDKYPCVRLLGAFKIGDEKLCSCNLKNNIRCKKCWAKNLCTFCTADVLLKNKKFPYTQIACSNKKLYKYTLKKIIELMLTDQEKLSIIISNYLGDYIY